MIWLFERLILVLDARSKYLRSLVLDQIALSRRGHLGSALSIMELVRVLYDNFLKYRSSDIWWEGRDRFILSKGHGCMALYAILADKGFFSKSHLQNFCGESSFLGGHPERNKVPGVEASTGSLGHGLSIGVGIALSLKIKNMSNKVVVLLGDGELNEGSIWEAFLSSSKHKLSNLLILIDYNKFQSAGPISEVLEMEPLKKKFRSFNLAVSEINGHDIQEITKTLTKKYSNYYGPHVIICHTIKGKGFKFAENNLEYHHKNNITDAELNEMTNAIK